MGTHGTVLILRKSIKRADLTRSEIGANTIPTYTRKKGDIRIYNPYSGLAFQYYHHIQLFFSQHILLMPIPKGKTIYSPFNMFSLIKDNASFTILCNHLWSQICCFCWSKFMHSIRCFFFGLIESYSWIMCVCVVQYHQHLYRPALVWAAITPTAMVLWQNRYKGIYVILRYLLFCLRQLPNTISHIPQNHVFSIYSFSSFADGWMLVPLILSGQRHIFLVLTDCFACSTDVSDPGLLPCANSFHFVLL